jgi:hypothetical protein
MTGKIVYKDATNRIPATFTPLETDMLTVLAYFDLFHYPLTIGEIEQFRKQNATPAEVHSALDALLRRKRIFRIGDFYSLQDNPLLSYRRIEANERAMILLKKATKIGRFLQQFPFVRAIGISGSLSKNYADERSDFDYFIITAANRLWIARTCMHLFKKLAMLFRKDHFYCMNYYIDEKNLCLEDQNYFTAVELKTLLPVSGEKVMNQFFSSNEWAFGYFPFCSDRRQEFADRSKSVAKRLFEWIMNNQLGDRLENYLFRLTTRRWKKKELAGKKNNKGEVMSLLTARHFAKSDPGHFQYTILLKHADRIREVINPS